MTDLASAQATLDAYSQAIQAVVSAVAPAVVRVRASKGGRKWAHGRARTDYGSGVIIDADAGHIVTNFHVVHNAAQAHVHLHDGTARKSQVVGTDADADLTVIQVEADNLTAAPWGDSSTLGIGSVVIALGNPDGDSVVASAGIVGALGRKLRGPSGRLLEGLIQTSAIFNPGMSGGPLVNSAGQVVGINTASMVEAQGINLAINSAAAQTMVADLIAYGEIRRPRLGIAGERRRLYEGLVRHHKLEQTHGVYVHEVSKDGPAAQGGIRPGDLLIGADDAVIEGLDDLHRVLASKNMGDTLAIRLLRDLELLEVAVTLTAPGA